MQKWPSEHCEHARDICSPAFNDRNLGIGLMSPRAAAHAASASAFMSLLATSSLGGRLLWGRLRVLSAKLGCLPSCLCFPEAPLPRQYSGMVPDMMELLASYQGALVPACGAGIGAAQAAAALGGGRVGAKIGSRVMRRI